MHYSKYQIWNHEKMDVTDDADKTSKDFSNQSASFG